MANATSGEQKKAMYLFNCAQRAHLNFNENHPSVMAAMLLSGIVYPQASAALGAVWSLGRIVSWRDHGIHSRGLRCLDLRDRIHFPHCGSWQGTHHRIRGCFLSHAWSLRSDRMDCCEDGALNQSPPVRPMTLVIAKRHERVACPHLRQRLGRDIIMYASTLQHLDRETHPVGGVLGIDLSL